MTTPTHLSAESKRHWRRITAEYEFSEDALLLLKSGLECYDRANQARELVTTQGLVLDGKKHPAIDIEKQAYGLFLRTFRQLNLDIETPSAPGAPLSSV